VANTIQGTLKADHLHFAIVVGRFNDFVSNRLVSGAIDTLERLGADEKHISVFKVPGSFEIPMAARRLAKTGKWDAVICLGTLIKGETPHFDFIATAVAREIAQAACETGVPISFGVITAGSLEQAIDRAGAKSGNKGADAAMCAVEMANLLKSIEAG
jgi:6,7-dimethyl-8-ribityllumazine synthase